MSCCGGSGPKFEESKSCETTSGKSGCGCGCGPECKCGPGCACRTAGACGDKYACVPKKCCPIKGALTVILGGILVAMVMYLFEGFWHGTYLAPIYDQTKTLWRSPADMLSLGGFYTGITVALGLIISLIFAKNYEGRGIGEGIRFGFLIGLLLGVKQATGFVVMPISLNLAMLWFYGWIIEGVLVGITLSLTYLAVSGKKDCKPKGACGPVASGCCR